MPDAKLLHILVEPDLRQALEDYRYANRYPTLAEAVRAVLRLGLKSNRVRELEASLAWFADAANYELDGSAMVLNGDEAISRARAALTDSRVKRPAAPQEPK